MMPDVDRSKTRSVTISIRVRAGIGDLIDQAAATLGQSRTEFILGVARQEATNVVLDRCLFAVSEETLSEFEEVLDQPPSKNPQLRKLLQTTPQWE